MDTCHDHNLLGSLPKEKAYGIRVALRSREAYGHVLGEDWESYRWYATPEQRDRALEEMASEHLYSRRGDRPTLIFEPVERGESG